MPFGFGRLIADAAPPRVQVRVMPLGQRVGYGLVGDSEIVSLGYDDLRIVVGVLKQSVNP